ncbi:unnamed protein product, partial [Strongylus vulgaris]
MHITDCRGVTFTGVIIPHKGEPNCLLVACRGDSCDVNERAEYNDGLISVLINRTQVTSSRELLGNAAFPFAPCLFTTEAQEVEPTASANFSLVHSTTLTLGALSSTYVTVAPIASSTAGVTEPTTQRASMALAPVWAVGLAIVIAVVCVGLNLGLLSAYICYRRQKSRK